MFQGSAPEFLFGFAYIKGPTFGFHYIDNSTSLTVRKVFWIKGLTIKEEKRFFFSNQRAIGAVLTWVGTI